MKNEGRREKEDGVRRKWIGLHKHTGGRSNDGVTMRLLCLDFPICSSILPLSSLLIASLRFSLLLFVSHHFSLLFIAPVRALDQHRTRLKSLPPPYPSAPSSNDPFKERN